MGHAHIFSDRKRSWPGRSGVSPATAGLSWNGGPVQHDPTYYAIFWLPSGTNYEPGIVNGDAGYESLMERYLKDAGSTNFADLVSQYYDFNNGIANRIQPATQYGGAWTDTTSYPESPLLDKDIQAAINRALAANPTWQDGVNSTFFVFTGNGIDSCMDSSQSSCTPGIPAAQNYCAYHNYFSDSNGNTAVYANMPEVEYWNAKNIFTGGESCETTNALPNGDIYADNEFAVLEHEQMEAITDPIPGSGWYGSGGEIGDLCNGQFGYQPYFGPSNANVNGDLYTLQLMWSDVDNACGGANSGSTGYYAVYGPYSAIAGASTGSLNLAQTVFVPSVNCCIAPNPTINWGDGTTNEPGGDTGCVICTLTGSHTYAYDPSASYPKTYQVTVTYNTGCCISYSQTLNIVVFAPTPLTITANDKTMTYGGSVPAFDASESGFINGDNSSVVQGLTCAATDLHGNPVSSSTPAGTYPINCSGATAPSYYSISYVAGTLTINPAALTITAKDQSTTYGAISFDTSPSSMTFNGFVNGEGPGVLGPGLTIKSNVMTGSPAGTYTLTPAAAVDPNYAITYDNGTLTVGRASLHITASSPTVTYSGQAPAITPGYSGLENGDSAPATPPACGTTPPSATNVGTYTTSCSGAADPNYSISYATGTLTINPARLTITANDKSMTYGGTVPGFDATFNGFVNGEGPGVLSGLTCGALDGHGNPVSATTPAGAYTIRCSGATDSNYSISYATGTLTINRAPLTITANNKTTIYGQPVPAFDASFNGFVNGEGPGVLSGLTCGALDGHGNPVSPTTPAGTYTINCSGATDPNYAISYQPGTFTVELFGVGTGNVLSTSSTSCHLSLGGRATVSVAGTLSVNGTSASALCLKKPAALGAGTTSVQGGVDNHGGIINGTLKTQQAPVTDLLATLPAPSAPAATCPGTACPGGSTLNTGHTYDLLPGTYTVPVTVNSGATACVAPGIYVLKANWTLNSAALRPYGSAGCPALPPGTTDPGVLLYFAQGSVELYGSGNLSLLQAMKGGPYAGLLYWQASSTTTNITSTSTVAGGGWYEPHGAVDLNHGRMTVPFVSVSTMTLNNGAALTVTGS